MSNLIYDRTQSDVNKVATYKAKFKAVASVGSAIQIATLPSGKYFVFDGTQSELDEYMAGMKGAYNATDMNRVGNAVNSAKDLLADFGITVSVSPKTNWTYSDVPTQSQNSRYITDLNTIKNASVFTTPSIPTTLAGLDYAKANAIEQMLAIVIDGLTDSNNAKHTLGFKLGTRRLGNL